MRSLPNILFVIILLLAGNSCIEKEEKAQLIGYVDPFIGTGAHGHTYPGAALPFGMVQLSPDNGINGWDWCSGYHDSDSIIVGFSHLHLSGTGIGDLADILVMPVNRPVDFSKEVKERNDYPYKSIFSHEDEEASPGYYRVKLPDNQVMVELTASKRSGFHKYEFEAGVNPAIVLDLSFAINWDKPTDTKIDVKNDTLVTGYRKSTGWAKDQRVFYAIVFSKPIEQYTTALDTLVFDGLSKVEGNKCKGQFFFANENNNDLMVKVGISSSSEEGALMNLMTEVPGWDFEKVVNSARVAWEKELSKIQVETADERLKTIFYTAVYHSALAPVLFSDLDGHYKGVDGLIHKADFNYYSTFSLWDTFRAANPLYTITQPDKINDFIKSMLAHYDEYGLLPVWALAANETNTMTGYHAIPVIVDAYFKGFRDYDVDKAYAALKRSAMQDIRGVNFFKEYGYIPSDLEVESVTKNLEYAYDDWCIARMAKDLGRDDDYKYFSGRAASYQLLFEPVTGFMRGKMQDGAWREPFDPKRSSHRVNTDYTEGNAWQHSWFVPHDVQGLINLFGSDDHFTMKLDSLFSESSNITGEHTSVDISGLIGQYAHGNEPSHHIAYMYNYAGKPWKAQYYIREIMDTQYTDQVDGLCGNEDCGQMSAWYVFSALGIYPVNPAEGIYVLGSPVFPKASIQLQGGNTFTIEAENVSRDNKYIQETYLNGQTLSRTYIYHEELVKGGELRVVMGSEPNETWGTGPDAVPPSMTKR